MDRWRKPLGAILLALSLFGAAYGVLVARSQFLYFQAKYGAAKDVPQLQLDLCRRSFSLYGFHYRLCILAAETAFYLDPAVTASGHSRDPATARFWCEEGLALNPYQPELRWMMAQYHSMESMETAIAYWKQYVDWDFWSPYSHSGLACLYARAGDFRRAEEELQWTHGSQYFDETRRLIEAERSRRGLSE